MENSQLKTIIKTLEKIVTKVDRLEGGQGQLATKVDRLEPLVKKVDRLEQLVIKFDRLQQKLISWKVDKIKSSNKWTSRLLKSCKP